MSPITSAVRCLEQLCEPAFFRRVAAMSGYSCGANPSRDLGYRRHDASERRQVASLLRRGASTSDAAREAGIAVGTVSKWRQEFVAQGKLQPKRIT